MAVPIVKSFLNERFGKPAAEKCSKTNSVPFIDEQDKKYYFSSLMIRLSVILLTSSILFACHRTLWI